LTRDVVTTLEATVTVTLKSSENIQKLKPHHAALNVHSRWAVADIWTVSYLLTNPSRRPCIVTVVVLYGAL